MQPLAHAPGLVAIAVIHRLHLFVDQVIEKPRRDLLIDQGGAETGVTGALRQGPDERPWWGDDKTDTQGGGHGLGDGADFVDDTDLVVGHHGSRSLEGIVVNQVLVSAVGEQRNLPIEPSRQVAHDIHDLCASTIGHHRPRRVVYGDDVDEADLPGPLTQFVDGPPQPLGGQTLVVFRDGDQFEAGPLQHVAVDVVQGVGDEDDAELQQQRETLQQAGGAVGADEKMSGIEQPFIHTGRAVP